MVLRLKIREIAQDRNWKLGQLQREAKLTNGVARRYWYGTRDGRVDGDKPLREVNLDTIETIAVALGVPASELIANE